MRLTPAPQHPRLALLCVAAGAAYCARWVFPDTWLIFLRWFLDIKAGAAASILNALSAAEWTAESQTLARNAGAVIELNTGNLKLYTSAFALCCTALNGGRRSRIIGSVLFPAWYWAASLASICLVAALAHESVVLPQTNRNANAVFAMLIAAYPMLLHYRTALDILKDKWKPGCFAPGTVLLKLAMILSAFSFMSVVAIAVPSIPANGIHKALTQILLGTTQAILRGLEFAVYIDGHKLTDGYTWTSIGEPCVGVQVMSVFAAFILVSYSPHNGRTAVVFVCAGIVSIMLINSVRIALLFVALAEQSLDMAAFLRKHDQYNYFVYLYIFALWCFWLRIDKSRGSEEFRARPTDGKAPRLS